MHLEESSLEAIGWIKKRIFYRQMAASKSFRSLGGGPRRNRRASQARRFSETRLSPKCRTPWASTRLTHWRAARADEVGTQLSRERRSFRTTGVDAVRERARRRHSRSPARAGGLPSRPLSCRLLGNQREERYAREPDRNCRCLAHNRSRRVVRRRWRFTAE
jgi:hypothetical protein